MNLRVGLHLNMEHITYVLFLEILLTQDGISKPSYCLSGVSSRSYIEICVDL
jgi:hypothetical protein